MSAWQVGGRHDLGAVEITYDMCIGNEGARPDIHNNKEIAQKAGFAEALVAGPHMLTICAEALTGLFGTAWIETGELSMRFVKPVLATETIAMHAVVRSAQPQADHTLVELDVQAEGSDGVIRFVGVASVVAGNVGE